MPEPQLTDRVRSALSLVHGTDPIVVCSLEDPNTIVAARNGGPIHVSEREVFVASSITVSAQFTNKFFISMMANSRSSMRTALVQLTWTIYQPRNNHRLPQPTLPPMTAPITTTTCVVRFLTSRRLSHEPTEDPAIIDLAPLVYLVYKYTPATYRTCAKSNCTAPPLHVWSAGI